MWLPEGHVVLLLKVAGINHSPVISTQQAILSSLRGRAAIPVMSRTSMECRLIKHKENFRYVTVGGSYGLTDFLSQ